MSEEKNQLRDNRTNYDLAIRTAGILMLAGKNLSTHPNIYVHINFKCP